MLSFYTSTLKPINQCYLTGLEKLTFFETIPSLKETLKIKVYRDNFNQYRAVLIKDDKAISAVLVDSHGIIKSKFTLQQYRKNNYTRQLQAYMITKGITCKASQHQTTAGSQCYA